ncbi:hypothetical protein SEA_PHINKY_82 [Microbacterium phage Phinky]|nr:hypothetical protein SEA_PHINKY_82 [Microbacterium phage Phinky]
MAYRKQILLPTDELDTVREFAALSGTSASAVGAEWIDNFLERGSEYVAPEDGRLQIIIDRDKAEAAERKAREEYGCSLRDIIRFEIAELAKL